jgi:hypothetical protein
MAYIHIGDDSYRLGSSGCGPNCPCAPCRQDHAHLSEWYVKEDNSDSEPGRTGEWNLIGGLRSRRRNNMYLYAREGLGQFPTTLQPRKLTRSGYSFGPAPSAVEGFGQPRSPAQPAEPVFVLQCPAPPGCPPIAAGQCRAVLRQAIIEAIKLANNAASKIEAASKLEPSHRDAETKKTADLFKFFFGHDPRRPVPWAGNMASAVSVAFRFRAVAKALQKGGRNTIFRCMVARTDCNAFVRPPLPGTVAPEPNVVNLCAPFWNPPPGLRGLPPPYYRAVVIIHEMLHLLFYDFLLHHPPGRPNARCYEAFALRAAGFGADPSDVRRCFSPPP